MSRERKRMARTGNIGAVLAGFNVAVYAAEGTAISLGIGVACGILALGEYLAAYR